MPCWAAFHSAAGLGSGQLCKDECRLVAPPGSVTWVTGGSQSSGRAGARVPSPGAREVSAPCVAGEPGDLGKQDRGLLPEEPG